MGMIRDFKDERRRKRLFEEAHQLAVDARRLHTVIVDEYIRYSSMAGDCITNMENPLYGTVATIEDDETKMETPFYRALWYGAPDDLREQLDWRRSVHPAEFTRLQDPRHMLTIEDDVMYATREGDVETWNNKQRSKITRWVHVEPVVETSKRTQLSMDSAEYQYVIHNRQALAEGFDIYCELIEDEQNLVDAVSSLNDIVARAKSVLTEVEDAIARLAIEDDEDADRDIDNIDEHVGLYAQWKQQI